MDCWTEKFFENLRQEKPIQYITRNEINLNLLSDDEPWDPDYRIRQAVKHYDTIEVELLGKASNLNDVNRIMRNSKDVGLVLLGPAITRFTKPSLIVLACKERLYVIDPNEEKLIKFLKVKVDDKDIQFWTTNSIEESDCLYHMYGLKLVDMNLIFGEEHDQTNVQCCAATHIHLMNLMASLPTNIQLKYPPLAVDEARKRLRIESYERLVEIWLDISRSTFMIEKEKLSHLLRKPLSLTAVNIIKKRCILIRPLIKALKKACKIELRLMTREVQQRLILNMEQPNINSMIEQKIQECQNKDTRDYGYYSYLENGAP